MKRKYGSEPEYLWRRFPDYAIFRHEDNRKWYGLIVDISAEKLGLPGEGRVDILNVKLDDLMLADMLVQREGYLRGYHLNRGNWISILLDGTVPMKEIREMLDLSYRVTASARRFVKDGKIYKIEGTGLQSEQALKSGLSFQGKPIEFKLTDEWGWPIPEENLYKPYFGPRCLNCGMRLTCNGCSRCGKCGSTGPAD